MLPLAAPPPSAAFGAPSCAPTLRLRVLSLGAGVQSTTLALMAAHGAIGPMPDCAIFADTGWEPRAVYDHLAWLRSPGVLPFPVHVVKAGDLRADLLRAASGERWASIPAFTRTVARGRVSLGMIRRQCTKDYKIAPIRREVRALAGLTRRRSPPHPVVEQWIGISLDETIRMKPSFEAWADAVRVDRAVRTGQRGIRGQVFLHRSAVPLDEADLSTASDRGQLDLFGNECEGTCGV
jgi:hypothetical protein